METTLPSRYFITVLYCVSLCFSNVLLCSKKREIYRFRVEVRCYPTVESRHPCPVLSLSVIIPKRLEVLDGYLSEFDVSCADTAGSEIKWQKKKIQPWRVTEEFPAGEQNKGERALKTLEYFVWSSVCV